MLEDHAARIDEEEAGNALAAIASEGYSPGQHVRRHVLLPVRYPFRPDAVVARYSYHSGLCLKSTSIKLDHVQIDLDDLDEKPKLRWASIEFSGTIPQDAEPGVYRCDGLELCYGGVRYWVHDVFDLHEVVPNHLIEQTHWLKDIPVGSLQSAGDEPSSVGALFEQRLVSRTLDFRSREKVDGVEAWFQHSASGYKTITAQGIPKLTKTGPHHHYTVNLVGSIKYDDMPGSYVPYRVYYRINGRWMACSTKRRALSPFDVIESNPSSTSKRSEV